MKSKRDIFVCLCEVACCLVGGIATRVLITVVKNIIRSKEENV